MNQTTTRIALAVTGAMALVSVIAYGSPTIGASENWNGATDVRNWGLDTFGNSAGVTTALGSDYLTLSLDPTAGGGGVSSSKEGALYAGTGTHSADFTGNFLTYGSDLPVSFRFAALNSDPSSLALYFQGGGQTWLAYLDAPVGNNYNWVTYRVSVNNASWGLTDGTDDSQTALLTDLSSVTRFGVYVASSAYEGSQQYALDDFTLSVPEPDTVWLIAAALASLGITFRGKAGGFVRGVLKRA